MQSIFIFFIFVLKMPPTNQIIILLLSITTFYGLWIWYNSCFKQVKNLNKMLGAAQTEELDLDTQLENCEKRKTQLKIWIKDNQERINQKNEKLKNCKKDVDVLEIELEKLKKIRGRG
jgi:peptidoglycan hydrolase CwlO-like protein